MPHPINAFVSVLLWAVLASGTESGITGQVTDSAGAVIAQARVLVHWDPAGSPDRLSGDVGITQDVLVLTDANGDYTVAVPPGFYDVFISATAFTPAASKVRVKERKSLTLDAKLPPDPLVGEKLGDRFDDSLLISEPSLERYAEERD